MLTTLKRLFAGRPDVLAIDRQDNAQTADVLARHLTARDHCIDIGAHVGDIMISMVERAPKGHHHAIEALPHLAAGLRTRFRHGVTVHECAVSDTPGEADFQFVENDPGYSGLRRRIYDRPDPKVIPIRVQVRTLDSLIPLDQPIRLIKADIEGGEFFALKGGAATIQRCRPIIVFESSEKSSGQYAVSPNDFSDLFTQWGYTLTTMHSWLTNGAPYTRESFAQNWATGPDYYFLAQPQ